MSAEESIPQRQAELYTRLWAERRDDIASPDLIRHRVWRPYLVPPVLDIGAGDGVLARCHPDLEVVSVDLTWTGLRKVRDRGAAVGSAERLPLRAGHFATVVLSEVLEHVEDPSRALAECARVLRPGGRLLLSVPVLPLAGAERIYHRLRTGQPPTADNLAVWDPNHERRFTVASILDLLESSWQVEKVRPLFRSPSAFGMYFLEPRLSRLIARRRPVRLAHHLARLEPAMGSRAPGSGVAVVARRSRAAGERGRPAAPVSRR